MAKITAPHIEIYEYYAAAAPAVGPTRLMANIVGPLYRLKKDEFKAQYDGESDLLITFTQEPNTEFDFSYTTFKLRTLYGTEYSLPIAKSLNYPARINTGINGINITAAADLFIRPDDFIRINNPIPLRGEYKITSVLYDATTKKYSVGLTGLPSDFSSYNDIDVEIEHLQLKPQRIINSTPQYVIQAYQGLNEVPVSNPSTAITATLFVDENTQLTFPKDIPHIVNGDLIYIIDSGELTALPNGSYKIVAKTANNVLIIDHKAGKSETGVVAGYCIYGNAVPSGKIYANSRALDKSYDDIIVINSVQDLINRFGDVDLDNPLVFGVYIAMMNGAVPCYAQAIPSNDNEGYMAVTEIWDKRDFYVVAPLTDSDVIINSYHTKAVALSAPEVAKWKRVVAGKSIPKVAEFFTGTNENITGGLVKIDDTKFSVRFTATTNVPWNKVIVNKTKFVISNCSNPNFNGEYQILEVNSATKTLICAGNIGIDQTALTFNFALTNPLTTSEQVEILASYGEIYASRLISIIVGDVYTSIDGRNVKIPTYYAAAGLAGMVEGYAPHVQFNGYPIAGITKVENTWDRFNEDELSTIAGGGVIILVQKTPASLPYIRNQLTTDVSDLLKRSLSIVKSVDYFKRLIYDNVVDFLKGWNVVTEAIEALQIKLQAVINFARRFNVPKCGTLILNASIDQITPAGNAIEIVISAIFPKPLETLKIELYIS